MVTAKPVYPKAQLPGPCREVVVGFVPALEPRPADADALLAEAMFAVLLPDNHVLPAPALEAAVRASVNASGGGDAVVTIAAAAPAAAGSSCLRLVPDLRQWTLTWQAEPLAARSHVGLLTDQSADCALPADTDQPVAMLVPVAVLRKIAWTRYRPTHLGILAQVVAQKKKKKKKKSKRLQASENRPCTQGTKICLNGERKEHG